MLLGDGGEQSASRRFWRKGAGRLSVCSFCLRAFELRGCALTPCVVLGTLPSSAVCLQVEEVESCPGLLRGGRPGVLSGPPRNRGYAPSALSERLACAGEAHREGRVVT